MQAPNGKRNMERMEESVSDFNYEATQRFISESTWSHDDVYDAVAKSADEKFRGRADTCLLIDDSGFAKKGGESAGVSRQWNGRLGKVDNCQIGVFCSLNSGNEVIPVQAKLYLPEEWTLDQARMEKAKIPSAHQAFKTKHVLALEMIDRQVKNNIHFNWIGADGFYGNAPEFLREIAARKLTFMLDVHSDQHVYLTHPEPEIPEPGLRGRTPTQFKSSETPIRVDKLIARQKPDAWKLVKIRDITKGPLKVETLNLHVWLWNGKESNAKGWTLVVTRDSKTKKDLKYSLSNAPDQCSDKQLAFMQRQRYWIENAFETAKSTCGLADYQVRSWVAWHHHVAMVFLAMLFIVEEKKAAPDHANLLSPNDVRELLMHFLPQKKHDPEEIFRQLESRHLKRQRSFDSAMRLHGDG